MGRAAHPDMEKNYEDPSKEDWQEVLYYVKDSQYELPERRERYKNALRKKFLSRSEMSRDDLVEIYDHEWRKKFRRNGMSKDTFLELMGEIMEEDAERRGHMELIEELHMPPFARNIFVSAEAEDHWGPKFRIARRAFSVLETLSVKVGLRPCTTTHVQPENMAHRSRKYAENGLYFLPIRRVGSYSGYATYHPPVRENEPWNYYGVVSHDKAAAEKFRDATRKSNHKTMGRLLGYPECCIRFYEDFWRKRRYTDPVWQQAVNTSDEYIEERTDTTIVLNTEYPHHLFPAMRDDGLRLYPHITCSLDCAETANFVDDWIELGRSNNVAGLELLMRILEWPIEWSALKGIALVSNPIFRISTNSVACHPEYTVRKRGVRYPEEAPEGLKFPWSAPDEDKTWDPDLDFNKGVEEPV